MAYVMTVQQFIEKLNLALKNKSLYILGGFGAPLNNANKARYINKNAYNKRRKNMIMAARADTFAFDCVNLGKGILWGWNANNTKINGGAVYGSNGVPDTNEKGMFDNYCYDKSSDFSKIQVGEFLWMPGHCGYYIGNGLAVECTPKWKNGVQITAVGNIGKIDGYNTRTWKYHGKWKFLNYGTKMVAVYRLYNPNGGKHCFTIDKDEVNKLAKLGWRYEGVGWYAPSQGDPVYRVYDKSNGDHLYTMSKTEYNTLVKRGLVGEGVAFYSDKNKSIPVYRMYNPNTGEHFFTASIKERDGLRGRKWDWEGTGVYAMKG